MNLKTKNNILQTIHKIYSNRFEHELPALEDTPELKKQLLSAFEEGAGNSSPEERDVNILLSDLRGFTSISEDFTPLEIIDLLNRYFAVMTEIIQKYDGSIDKFMGDAIMVVFGANQSRDDDLERTIACAIEMQQGLAEFNENNRQLGYPPLYMGIGINTGKVVAGKLGSDIYSEHTVIGDHVNLASRIESYSSRGQVLISEHTYEKSKNYIETGAINEISLKGIEKSVKLYELIATDRPTPLRVPQTEIRKSPRIDINMPVRFKKVHGKSKSADEYMGEILDLGYGGMYVETKESLTIYAEICFPLSLSISGNLSREVYAKVVRINPCENRFRYHLEFSSIPQDAETALKRYIDRIVVGD